MSLTQDIYISTMQTPTSVIRYMALIHIDFFRAEHITLWYLEVNHIHNHRIIRHPKLHYMLM